MHSTCLVLVYRVRVLSEDLGFQVFVFPGYEERDMMSCCSNNQCTLMTFQEVELWMQATRITLWTKSQGHIGFRLS